MILVFLVAGCRKEDLQDLGSQAMTAKKGIPVLSETWVNGMLQQKNYYADGKLVKVVLPAPPANFPREYVYTYPSQDHYVIMTGDYMYWHYYFNAGHQLIRADVADEDGSLDWVWVRHEFTWDKDRIKTHSWFLGDFLQGNYSGTKDVFDYKNPWAATLEEYDVSYVDGVKVEETLANTFYYRWQSPFESRTSTGPDSYIAYIYSNLIKIPSYNIAGFPWGYFSIDLLRKHEMMNMLATNWGTYSSGMLLLEQKEVNNGTVHMLTQKRNIVVNKDKLPDSYDEYNYASGNSVHYEFKYIRL